MHDFGYFIYLSLYIVKIYVKTLKHVKTLLQVIKNLHIVFTMNPSTEGLKDRAATSPALFNRCVLNWFGDWSKGAFYQVGKEFTAKIDLEKGGVCSHFLL